MAPLTKFLELRQRIESLGVIVGPEGKLLKRLGDGNDEFVGKLEDSDLIFGNHGLYVIEDGVLAKVVLHICDIDIYWISRRPNAQAALNGKVFSDAHLIEVLHKYHFTNCQKLQEMTRSGRQYRYHKAQRLDGTFYYYFLDSENLVSTNKNQRLYVCSFCLNSWKEQTGQDDCQQRNFPSSNIFANDLFPSISDNGYVLDCDAVPNIYAGDWEKISQRAKEKAGWKCKDCLKDFSQPKMKPYLDCHHKDHRKYNNSVMNLEVLCVIHHAERNGHAHMKNTPRYKEYKRIADASFPI